MQLKILPRKEEKYVADWKFELGWTQYIGSKSATIHEHFNIPKDTPEGKYDFYFIILDSNGSKLVIKEDFAIVDPASLPTELLISRAMI